MTMTQPSRPPMYGPPPREPEKPVYVETNHILHLLLTILTFGFWVLIWILVAMNHSAQNEQRRKRYKQEYLEYENAYILWQFGSGPPQGT